MLSNKALEVLEKLKEKKLKELASKGLTFRDLLYKKSPIRIRSIGKIDSPNMIERLESDLDRIFEKHHGSILEVKLEQEELF